MPKPTAADNPSDASVPRHGLKLGALGDNLGYLVRAVRNVNQQSGEAHLADLQFANGQITLLGLIAANKVVTQNQLIHATVMRKSQVTALVQDLVTRGYVQREPHGADRRYNTLALTREGQAVWRKALARISRHSEEMQAPLDPSERQELARLLRKLLGAVLPGLDIEDR